MKILTRRLKKCNPTHHLVNKLIKDTKTGAAEKKARNEKRLFKIKTDLIRR